MPVANFDRDLKRLVPVGHFCSAAGEDILKIPQDCLLCTYQPMFFLKDQKKIQTLIIQEQS